MMTSPRLTKYLDALPIPPVLQLSGIVNGLPRYNIAMSEFQQSLHSQLPATTLWGYNGQYPGPTFEMRSLKPVTVKCNNSLPTTHLLQDAIDPTLHGTEPPAPYVRNVVHLHGAKILPESDGYPEAWFTPGFTQTGPFFDHGSLYLSQ